MIWYYHSEVEAIPRMNEHVTTPNSETGPPWPRDADEHYGAAQQLMRSAEDEDPYTAMPVLIRAELHLLSAITLHLAPRKTVAEVPWDGPVVSRFL